MIKPRTEGFRPDIEGLRAFAVVPIILFHLNEAFCPGGYIGVDVFFVLSGYLITKMIVQQGADFRFKTFYIRRFKRLFPALLTTVELSLIAGWFLLIPSDFMQLSWSGLSAVFAVSNLFFYGALDYFNNENIYHPLLHTWSLGVEEQFYLFWPLVLIWVLRAGKSPFGIIILIMLVSVLVLLFLPVSGGSMPFYFMPFRIFEFAAGAALLTFEIKRGKNNSSLPSLIGGWIGFVALFYGFMFFDQQMAWPGVMTLLPVMATILLIHTGKTAFWKSLLGQKGVRYIGRISYSLYLVHWPIISFYKIYMVTGLGYPDYFLLVMMIVIAAMLLYHMVEVPFRYNVKDKAIADRAKASFFDVLREKINGQSVQSAILASSVLVVLLGAGSIIVSGGFPKRYEKKQIAFMDKGLSFAGDQCGFKRLKCEFGLRTSDKTVFLIGDSHALNLVFGLDELFRANGIRGIALFDHGCLFLKGTQRFFRGRPDEDCAKNIAQTYQILSNTNAPVIMAGDYDGYRNTIGMIGAGQPLRHNVSGYHKWLEQKLTESLKALNVGQRKIIIFKQNYMTGSHPVKCLSAVSGSKKGKENRCHFLGKAAVQKRFLGVDHMVDQLQKRFPSLAVVDPKELFCKQEDCVIKEGNNLYFRDVGHLTNLGSHFLIQQARPVLLGLMKSGPETK